MYKLKLIKGRSYRGAVTATQENPYVVTDSEEVAQAAITTGYFELCPSEQGEPDTEPDTEPDDDTEPDYEALAKMTKAELERYAAEHDISLDGRNTKADMLEAISVAHGGSPTMIELQRE